MQPRERQPPTPKSQPRMVFESIGTIHQAEPVIRIINTEKPTVEEGIPDPALAGRKKKRPTGGRAWASHQTERTTTDGPADLPEFADDDEYDADANSALKKTPANYGEYVLPTTDYLHEADASIEQNDASLQQIARDLSEKTKEFNVAGKVMHICPGPVVTTYEFKPDPGVKYSRVTGLVDDLCLS